MARKKDNTYLIPDMDNFSPGKFTREVENGWKLRKQLYKERFRPLKCKCILGNCSHKNHLCKAVIARDVCYGEEIVFKYAR